MSSSGAGNMVGDEDDFTYTEDASGQQKKVAVEKEFIFKVVVLGDYSVGKTCLIKRLLGIHSLDSASPAHGGSDMEGSSSEDDNDDDEVLAAVTPTVGTDFYSLALPHVLPGASLRLQLWDTAGLEKYAAKYENTFRNASFVICVFDVTSASSLHNVVDRHLSIAAEHIPELDQSNIMVVANKIDIISDMANNTTALRDARKRAQSPETAFAEANDDDTATNTEFFTSVKGIDKDAIVTAKNVQAEVFDLFGEVHYAEVSAKTRQNVRLMLQTVAYALLRNSPEANGTVAIPEVESTYDIFAHTVLPMQTSGNSAMRHSPQVASPTTPNDHFGNVSNTKDPLAPTPPPTPPLEPPASAERNKKSNKNAEKEKEKSLSRGASPPPAALTPPITTPPKPAASWGTTGAFKFDMAPPQLATTAVFSPVEGSEGSPHNNDNDINSPRNSMRSSDMPSATAPTVAAPPSVANSRTSVIKPDDVQVGLTKAEGATTARRPPVDPNETPQARKAREQAEMGALLGRAGQRKNTPAAEEAAAATTQAALRDDADKLEDDVAAGRDTMDEKPKGRPFTSLLDSLGMQDDDKKNATGNRVDDNSDRQASSDDEEGAQMHARLQDRFAQIEHDIRQDNAVARDRAKKEKKAKGKCKMCALM